ncbi:hypothetical protein A2U01_0071156, partial [Trifolium medium]|nr:hypothetical protein [Trifolium medium]
MWNATRAPPPPEPPDIDHRAVEICSVQCSLHHKDLSIPICLCSSV